jgi:glycosyltransferase involved in cell wall biosynthesis
MIRRHNKLVTIGIPTYNRSSLVLKSIESCLVQDYPNVEIIVSDNASTDETEIVVKGIQDKRVKYYRFDEPVQPYLNWNNCISHASGEYMTLLSDDDLLDKNFISALVAEFDKHPDASLVRGGIRCIDINGKKLWEYINYPYIETPEEFFINRIKNRRYQFLPGFLFKTRASEQAGMFEDNEMPAMLHLDDYFWFKMACAGNSIITSQQTYWSYRVHGEQYGGKLLDIGDFTRRAVRYVRRLSELATSQKFSADTVKFLKESYLDSMVAHRVYHEERRMASMVKSGLSVARRKVSKLELNSLLVIGNGPSIKGIDFREFSDCSTIAINYSYKSWGASGWYPDYYVSNDAFHVVNDGDGLLELLNGKFKGKIKKFLLRKRVLSVYPELAARADIEFIEDMPFYGVKAVVARVDSGGIGVLYGANLGFSNIYTIGIDLLYSSRYYEPTENRYSYYKVNRQSIRMKGHYTDNYYKDGYLARRPIPIRNLMTGWNCLKSELAKKNVKIWGTVRNSLLHGLLDYREYFNEPGYDGLLTPDIKLTHINNYEKIKPMIGKCQPVVPGNDYPEYMRLEENRDIPVDIEALRLFKNLHKGQRCFIVGNGPSLNNTDLSKLKNEITFGVNSIFLMSDINGFIPTYYSVCDSHVIAENTDRINTYPVQHKFFPSIFRKYISPNNRSNVSFFMMNRGFNEVTSPNYAIPRFSADCSERIFDGQTITYMNLQLAYYMGFSEVYLIGVDFSYVIPQSAIVDGANILSTEDDPNHFHKDYFGKGRSWHDPVLHRVIKNYEFADMVYKWDSRQVFNATVGGKLEAFQRVDYDSLFD